MGNVFFVKIKIKSKEKFDLKTFLHLFCDFETLHFAFLLSKRQERIYQVILVLFFLIVPNKLTE